MKNPIIAKMAALKAARLSADAIELPPIEAWMKQALLIYKEHHIQIGRLPLSIKARGAAGAMAHYISNGHDGGSLRQCIKAGIAKEWSFDAGILQHPTYFRRHFGTEILAKAAANLDWIAEQDLAAE